MASLLSDRQQEAIQTALELGYYEIPRAVSHEDVADHIGCAPSTAAEHLRKAESTLLGSLLA
ncbi:helix-turn-helix domain-containing protein [Halomicroarcula sp. F28]|uniref:helix-turn-helix domain-containing protein n=1 Tax=Haloarcula salinisoli TaxID=2487746 RepID=UPI001C732A9B|nr:helix-turn-helix domain-containing protein [Halomicroarcula salinisoli]MBX0287507.1 helix-turn-helix domain-containing protein [Halomicroarcula salinisoli]